MKLTEWFLNFDFNGRARRSYYWANLGAWLGVLFVFTIIGMALAPKAVDAAAPAAAASPLLGLAFFVILLLASIDNMAMVFRRAHDTGKSGWIWLVLLIPFINLLAFYWLMIEDSNQGPNKYGPPVKQFYQPEAVA